MLMAAEEGVWKNQGIKWKLIIEHADFTLL